MGQRNFKYYKECLFGNTRIEICYNDMMWFSFSKIFRKCWKPIFFCHKKKVILVLGDFCQILISWILLLKDDIVTLRHSSRHRVPAVETKGYFIDRKSKAWAYVLLLRYPIIQSKQLRKKKCHIPWLSIDMCKHFWLNFLSSEVSSSDAR